LSFLKEIIVIKLGELFKVTHKNDDYDSQTDASHGIFRMNQIISTNSNFKTYESWKMVLKAQEKRFFGY